MRASLRQKWYDTRTPSVVAAAVAVVALMLVVVLVVPLQDMITKTDSHAGETTPATTATQRASLLHPPSTPSPPARSTTPLTR